MDDAEKRLLTVFARCAYANCTMTMAVVGVNLFMSLYGLSVFLETPAPMRKGRRRYIITSFAITLLFSLASLDMANLFQTLFKSTSLEHFEKLVHFSNQDWKHFVAYTGAGLFIAVGDALLVYRCYIIYTDYRWVAVLPLITTLSGLGLNLAGLFHPNPRISVKTYSASSLLTVSTNIVVTSLIIFRLLRARRTFATLLPSTDMRDYTSVIAILVESAAPLTIFGFVSAMTQQAYGRSTPSIGLHISSSLSDFLFYSFCSLSPHMIIFRVTTGRSFTKFPTPRDNAAFSNPIQFAHQTAESSFIQSTFNRESGGNHPDCERGVACLPHISKAKHEGGVEDAETKS